MLDLYEADRNLMEALHQKDMGLLLAALRTFHVGHLQTPPRPLCDIHDLEQGRGAQLVQALKTAVEQNYVSGMIILLDPQRVQRVLQTVDPQMRSTHEGVTNLKFIAAVFEENTDGIAHVWHDFVLGANGTFERSSTQIIDFLKTYKNASEMYMVEQERQRLNQAVGEYPPQISSIKKM